MDDGILGGLKDILFGTTGPRGGKKDGVSCKQKAPPAVRIRLYAGCWGVCWGKEGKSGGGLLPNPLPKGRGPGFELAFNFINNVNFAPCCYVFSLTATG